MLNRNSSQEEKREAKETVFDELASYFFDRVVFISLLYSDLSGGGTTDTVNFGKLSRIMDTSQGKLMSPGKESRMRCNFYLKNPDKLDGYLLSPVVYDEQLLPTNLTTMTIFRSYVGLKFSNNKVYVVVKQAGKDEVTYLLNLTLDMLDATFTYTYTLEILHNGTSTDIYIDDVLYGSYSSDMIGSFTSVETFFPFFAPAKSKDGTITQVVAEHIQFIQNKQ